MPGKRAGRGCTVPECEPGLDRSLLEDEPVGGQLPVFPPYIQIGHAAPGLVVGLGEAGHGQVLLAGGIAGAGKTQHPAAGPGDGLAQVFPEPPGSVVEAGRGPGVGEKEQGERGFGREFAVAGGGLGEQGAEAGDRRGGVLVAQGEMLVRTRRKRRGDGGEQIAVVEIDRLQGERGPAVVGGVEPASDEELGAGQFSDAQGGPRIEPRGGREVGLR